MESNSPKQLMLIGPDPDMIELLKDILGDQGYSVSVVDSIDELQGALLSVDDAVVLCDELSSQFDGLRLWNDLRDRVGGATPGFMLLTDNGSGERIRDCLEAGMHEVMYKPFDLDELDGRLAKVFRVLALERRPVESVAVVDEDPAPPRAVGFSGELEYLGLPDLMMNLHQNARTGELVVTVADGDYIFSFRRGELTRVDGPRGLKHRKALFRAMRESLGRFSFNPLEQVRTSRQTYENMANLVLMAVQEADEYPLYRDRLSADPVPVTLSTKADSISVAEHSAIQPLLEGLIKSTTIDILIHACPNTDLAAAKELRELMEQDVLVTSDAASAEAAS
ncbi:MAG: DUF4388 domain-containing protein [bacterium]